MVCSIICLGLKWIVLHARGELCLVLWNHPVPKSGGHRHWVHCHRRALHDVSFWLSVCCSTCMKQLSIMTVITLSAFWESTPFECRVGSMSAACGQLMLSLVRCSWNHLVMHCVVPIAHLCNGCTCMTINERLA